MNYGFNKNQLNEDVDDFLKFTKGFVTSFGPSPKKALGKEVGILEAAVIRTRLSVVEMGISKVIRTVIVLIVGLILFFGIFRYADTVIRLIVAGGFFFFYAWMMGDHLVDANKEPVSFLAKMTIKLFNAMKDAFTSIGGMFQGK